MRSRNGPDGVCVCALCAAFLVAYFYFFGWLATFFSFNDFLFCFFFSLSLKCDCDLCIVSGLQR